MTTWRVTAPGGQVFRVTGDSPPTQEELDQIFLRMVGEQSVERVQSGAMERSQVTPGDEMRQRMERLKTVDPERERELNTLVRSKEPGAAGTALALTAGLAAAPATIPTTMAGLKAAALPTLAGLGGAQLGGSTASAIGLPRWVGSVIGGAAGVMSPSALMGAAGGHGSPVLLRFLSRLGRNVPSAARAARAVRATAPAVARQSGLQAAPAAVPPAMSTTMMRPPSVMATGPANATMGANVSTMAPPRSFMEGTGQLAKMLGQEVPATAPAMTAAPAYADAQQAIIAKLQAFSAQPGGRKFVREWVRLNIPKEEQRQFLDMILSYRQGHRPWIGR